MSRPGRLVLQPTRPQAHPPLFPHLNQSTNLGRLAPQHKHNGPSLVSQGLDHLHMQPVHEGRTANANRRARDAQEVEAMQMRCRHGWGGVLGCGDGSRTAPVNSSHPFFWWELALPDTTVSTVLSMKTPCTQNGREEGSTHTHTRTGTMFTQGCTPREFWPPEREGSVPPTCRAQCSKLPWRGGVIWAEGHREHPGTNSQPEEAHSIASSSQGVCCPVHTVSKAQHPPQRRPPAP